MNCVHKCRIELKPVSAVKEKNVDFMFIPTLQLRKRKLSENSPKIPVYIISAALQDFDCQTVRTASFWSTLQIALLISSSSIICSNQMSC